MPVNEKKVKNPGSKGGKYYINDKGKVIYGEKPEGKKGKIVDDSGNEHDRIKYDPKLDFKKQFPGFEEFNKLAKEKGLPEMDAKTYKQIYQREHKEYMKHVDEAKKKGEGIKGLGDKKDFLKQHVYFDEKTGKFNSKSFPEIEAEAKKAGFEISKEEFMKHYKQEKYAELKHKKKGEKPEPEKPKPEEPKPEKPKPEEPKPEPEKPKKEEPNVFGENGDFDKEKLPSLTGSPKQKPWAYKLRGMRMYQIKDLMKERTPEEQGLIKNLASRMFTETTYSGDWIGNKDVSVTDLLSKHLWNEKENSIFEKIKGSKPEKPKPEKPKPEEPKPEPEKPKLNLTHVNEGNWYNFHQDAGEIHKQFPELKGGSKQVKDAENIRGSMTVGWDMKKFQEEYVQQASYTQDEIKLFADSVNNMMEEKDAKKWIAMRMNYKTPFYDKLAEYSSDKEAFGKLIEKWKAGKAEADTENEKKKKAKEEEDKKKADEEAKKKAEADAKKKAETDKLKNKEDDPEYQKEQVQKLQKMLDESDTTIFSFFKQNHKMPVEEAISKLESDVLGYKLTDWEKLNLTEIRNAPNPLTKYGVEDASQKASESERNIRYMIKAKINPETGLFNKNIYDNFLRESNKEISEKMDDIMMKGDVRDNFKEILGDIEKGDEIKITSQRNVIGGNGGLTYSKAIPSEVAPIAKQYISDIMNKSGFSNMDAINALHEIRKQKNAEFDKLRAYNYVAGDYANKNKKFTPEEKKKAAQLQKELRAIDGIKYALAEKMKDYQHYVNDNLVFTENNNDKIVSEVRDVLKHSKSPNFKAEGQKAIDFYTKALKPDTFNQDIKYENVGKSRACAYGNTVYIHFASERASTIVHEMGHVLENQNAKDIGVATNFFYAGRTNGVREYNMKYAEYNGYELKETSKIDSFMDSYTGKNYYNHSDSRRLKSLDDSTSHEVISMGIQRMYDNPMQFMIHDPEHFALTYSVLKGKLK